MVTSLAPLVAQLECLLSVRSVIGDSLYTLIRTKSGVEPGLSHYYYEIMRADTSSAATVAYYKKLAIDYHYRCDHLND